MVSATPENRQTIGSILRLQREAQNLDLDSIARETRIPRRHLIAFEADHYEDLPARPYAIGFLRTYAGFLGMSSDELVDQFKAETSRNEPVQVPSYNEVLDDSRFPSKTLAFTSAGVVVVAILGGWLLLGRSTPEEVPAQPVLTEPAPIVEPEVVQPQAADAPETVAPVPAATPQLPAPQPGIVVRAIEDSWIRISDGGPRAVKMDTLKAGETFTVPDIPGLMLQTGNAGGLVITVDGKPVAPLGERGIVVRNVSLDRQSLLQRLVP